VAARGVERPAGDLLELGLEDAPGPPICWGGPTREAGGLDGFVSFECTPDLADASGATIEQPLGLWRRLERANVMIK
jgi:hypothetical protein